MGTYDTFWNADESIQIQCKAFNRGMDDFYPGSILPPHYPRNAVIHDTGCVKFHKNWRETRVSIFICEGKVTEVNVGHHAARADMLVFDERGQNKLHTSAEK